jgi:hypothetical protein
MLKKMVIVSILFLLIVSFSKTAGAAITVTNPWGYYQITDGKLTLNVNFPNILTLNVSLPKMALLKTYLGGCLVFFYWSNYVGADFGAFGLYFPVDLSSIIPGTSLPISSDTPTWVGEWQVTGPGKFTVVPIDADYYTLDTLSDLEDYINDLLSGSGLTIPISVTVTKYSFTGTQDSKDKLKANLSLGIGVNIYEGIVKGTITITASLTTSKGTADSPAPLGGSLSALNGGGSASFKGLGNLVVNILKTLPLEDLVPAK